MHTQPAFQNLVELLQARARELPSTLAFTFLLDGESGETSLTFAELDARARDIAARLQQAGAAGERVLLMYPPGLEYIAGFFGCLYAGSVAVPVYPPRPDRPLNRFLSILEDAEPTFALATEFVCAMAEPMLAEVRPLKWLATDVLDGARAAQWTAPVLAPEALAFLQYTSGSTANPKGVMVSHGNLLHNQALIQRAFGTEPSSRVVGWLPLYHDMGLIGNVLHPMWLGTSCVLLSPLEFLREPLRWLKAISDFQGTVSGGPNFAYDLCVRKVPAAERAKLDLSRWQVAFNGAEPIRHETLERFAEAFAVSGFRKQAFVPCYGLAEATLLVTGGRPQPIAKWFQSDALEQKRALESPPSQSARALVACGESWSLRIVDPQTRAELPPGGIGEIWVANDSVAGGYWRKPEVTRETFQARTTANDGPYLRTGDLGFVNDGQLFVAGRIKDLLIIRGRNHYPQDIELTAEQAHPMLRPGCGAAFSVDVDGEERLVLVQEVVSTEGVDAPAVTQAIRQAIARAHDLQTHAVVLIAPRSIPKTSSGKIQRSAARAGWLKGELEVVGAVVEAQAAAAAPDVAAWLAKAISARVGAAVDVNAPIASFALDSLQIVELTHELETALGVRVPMEAFFGRATVAEVAARVTAAPPAATTGQGSSDQALSSGQRALWLLNQLDPHGAGYSVPAALRLKGEVDRAALERALRRLAERHELLRSRFPLVDGAPVRRVGEASELPFGVEQVAPERLHTVINAFASLPFALERELPIRVALFESGGERTLVVSLHHLVTDFWSQGVLLRELAAFYVAEKAGTPARVPAQTATFQDFVRWQSELLASSEGERLASYWLGELAGELPVLELPTKAPRPAVQSFRGAVETVSFDVALTEQLKAFAQTQRASPYMVLLAAFQTLLHRVSGQAELVVGSVATGRSQASFASVPGYFANPIALRSRVQAGQSFERFLAETKRVVLGALAHQDYPFTTLVERLKPPRDASRSPVFQAMFVMQKGVGLEAEAMTGFAMNLPGATLPWADLQLESVPLEQHSAQFDLSLTAGVVDGRLVASFDYAVELFDAAFVRDLARHFEQLVRAIVTDASTAALELAMLSPADRAMQLQAWNATSTALSESTVHGWVARQCAATPSATAIISGDRQLSYTELDQRSNQLANALRRQGVGPERVVGICLERGADLVVAMLGVLKAGAAYVPVEPHTPEARVRQMLSACGAELVVTEAGLAGPFTHRLLIEAVAAESTQAPSVAVQAASLACVIFTSGSTGVPKGVMLEHGAIVNLIASFISSYRVQVSDRMLPITSIASASFVGEVFPMLCSGGALVVPSREEMLDEARLAQLIVARGVTILSTLPSRLSTLTDAERSLARVRLVLSGGEALTARELPGLGKGLELVNGFGLTETAVCSTYHFVKPSDLEGGRPIPLGKPIQNTQLYVLSPELELLPVGSAGELYVGGQGLARGYTARPAATAERFVPSPFGAGERLYRTGDRVRWNADGTLTYLGRFDQQIKLRGHRIELAEIESALRSQVGVRDAVVVVRGEGATEKRLVAYVVAKGEAVSSGSLLAHLRERLPEHMVPAAFVALDALPLSPNGKIDHRALPAPAAVRPELASSFSAPRGQLEEIIASVWKANLGLEHVGADDNFFDLGGHSLLLVKVHAQLKETLQRELTLVDLFRYPTVKSLATHLSGAPAPVVAPVRAEGKPQDDAIAIVGVAGRFPGAANPSQLWDNLKHGVESITFFTDDELRAAGVDQALLDDPNYIKANGIIDGIDQFDAPFFNLSPRETELMDPQHRVFLECAWEALESAGYDSLRYPGRIGVFAGCSMNTYLLMNLLSHLKLVASIDTLQASLGNDKDPLTSRVSYKLDLKGPSITIQSASSTSLVAVHVACQTLLSGACEMALAGGVSIHLPSKSGYMFQEGGTTARDGHCRAFDADASGFVSGKGAGVVVLKRLSDAVRDGDHIHAVIRGSACNNDGALKVSYTAPSVEGQVDVYRQAMANAGVTPKDISYIECHGTGTALGDPIEITALTQAFSTDAMAPGSCALGSLKTNIGHLDNAAGVCGLIKATLCVEHGQLVPTLHYKKANPQIDFGRTPFVVNTELREWRSPRVAGVTSLGMGGTNAHLIVGEAPARPPSGPSRAQQLLLWSARTETAADLMGERLAQHLEANPDVSLADVAWVLHVGRRQFKHRRALVCASREEAIALLRSPDRRQVSSNAAESDRPVAFLFSGQGSQHLDLGRDLYDREPLFRAQVDQACELLRPELGFDLRDKMFPAAGADREEAARQLNQTSVTQPALFVIEYALARLVMSWGITPDALLGHSLGEFVAACLAGVFSLPDALSLVAARGRFMQQMPPGSMLAVPLSSSDVTPWLGAELCVAAVNQPQGCVVSGPTKAIEALKAALAEKGLEARVLQTSHAFHSSMLEPAVPLLFERVKQVALSAPKLRVLSNLTGTWLTDEQATDPRYWVLQMRQAVQFAPAVSELLKSPTRVCVEIGPGQALSSFVRSHPARTPRHEVVSLMRHMREVEDDQRALLRGLGRLWNAGLEVSTDGFWVDQQRRRVPLPTYPFERKRHWVEPKTLISNVVVADERQRPSDWLSTPSWKEAPRARTQGVATPKSTWVVSDGTARSEAMVDALQRRAQPVIVITAGAAFERLGDLCTVELGQVASWELAWASLPAPERIVWVSSKPHDLERAFFAPLAAVRASGGGVAVELTFVTTGVFDVTGAESLVPVHAAVVGASRVVPLEYTKVRTRIVDLTGDTTAARVVDELLGAEVTDVALRAGRRWVCSHEPVRIELPTGPGALRPAGVFVVTGGLGGVGLELASELARRSSGATLVLVGRRGVPPRAEWPQHPTDARLLKLLELEQRHGARVEVIEGDVATDAARLVDEVTRRFGALHGVIHAAGVPGGGLIQLRERAASEAVFAGKVHGALGLARALETVPVDFVVLCSSLTSVVAMPGQADYVAANAVLDALAIDQAKRGKPWVSINWDAWREVGMAAEADGSALGALREQMLRDGLSNAEAVDCLNAALASGLPQVIVSTHPLAVRLAAGRTLAEQQATADHAPVAAATVQVADGDIERHIIALWKEMLGVDGVGLDDNFFDLGGSSIVGIGLIGRLRSELGVELSEVGLFQAPTVRTLAALIREGRSEAGGGTAAADDSASRGQRRRERRTRRTGADHE